MSRDNIILRKSTWLGLTAGVIIGWLGATLAWFFVRLAGINPQDTLRLPQNKRTGITFTRTTDRASYIVGESLEDGIERISYRPTQARFRTPLLFVHGMWHGAWMWQPWQELFAVWGWENISFSLPGHAGSPAQKPLAECTLDYYLSFLRDEVLRFPIPPVLIGHSMGGGLVHWYLRHVGHLPAAVLVTPYTSPSLLLDVLPTYLLRDPLGVFLTLHYKNTGPLVRTPQLAARMLLGPHTNLTPEALHYRLGPEAALPLLQHNPPFWSPPKDMGSPVLWLGAEMDQATPERLQRRAASRYGADYYLVEQAGHDLMYDHNSQQTASSIHSWLTSRGIN